MTRRVNGILYFIQERETGEVNARAQRRWHVCVRAVVANLALQKNVYV